MSCRVIVLILLASLLLPVPARAKDDGGLELKRKSKLTVLKLRSPPLRSYLLPDGVKAAESPTARRAKIGRQGILLVDVDGNGRFDDRNRDGWRPLTADSPYVVPLEEKLVVGTDVVDWRIEEGVLRYRAVRIVLPKDQLLALQRLNDFRVRNGLVPVGVSRDHSAAARKHLMYMQIHGMTHRQKKIRSGYTEEGAKSGSVSVLYAGPPASAVAWYWCSAFHRFPLAHPDVRSYGIASGREFTVWDGVSDREPRRYSWPVLLPAPDSTGHPVRLAQKEMPRCHRDRMNPGCPVSIHFPDGSNVTKVKAELLLGGERGRPWPMIFSSPEKPVQELLPGNDYSILVVPRVPLSAKTKYFVRVSYEWKGKRSEHAWTFTTGKDILGR